MVLGLALAIVVALLVLLFALLAGEGAIAICAYLFAYAMVLDEGSGMRRLTSLPLYVGFGIAGGEQARAVAVHADGVELHVAEGHQAQREDALLVEPFQEMAGDRLEHRVRQAAHVDQHGHRRYCKCESTKPQYLQVTGFQY